MPTVSLIITTYNWAQALRLVLESVMHQTTLPDEIVVADDGSTDETKAIIEQYQRHSPVPILHAWQSDKGFRVARSRNNAVACSQGEYLIFVDGDMILHSKFIDDHVRFAKNHHFTVGSRVLLSKKTTESVILRGTFDYSLWNTKADNKLNALYAPLVSKYFAEPRREPIRKWIFKVRSCNMAVWRSDYEAINGFNHDFQGWGREDSEFALRLFKKGLSMRRLKFCAIQYHLHHHENDRTQLNANDNLLTKALAADSFRCRNGLDQLLGEK